MSWQDTVYAGVGWAFSLALLPMLRRNAPMPPVLTALLNAVLLTVLAATMASQGAFRGAASMGLTALLWGWIAWRGHRGFGRRNDLQER